MGYAYPATPASGPPPFIREPVPVHPYFWTLLWTAAGIAGLVLFYRRKLEAQLKSGTPPGFAVLGALAVWFALAAVRAIPTGDEPHYLLMTQSLLGDGDFDLRNNYQQQDYLAYYPDVIPDPHIIVTGERWYPVHATGLPILVAPAYAAGGRIAVVIVQVLVTVAALRVLWSILQLAGCGPRASGIATLVAGLTLPLAAMAGQVFPEVWAVLLVTVALRAMLVAVPSGLDRLAFVLSVFLLPWLHPKYAALAGALVLAGAIAGRGRTIRPTLALAAGVLVASVAGHGVLSDRWYGAPLPGASILVTRSAAPSDWIPSIVHHFLATPWVGLFGILLDQQSGLLLGSPVYALAIPGMVLLWRHSRRLAIACGLIFASVYLPAGSFGVWYAGYSSPARLLTPAVPVLAIGLAGLLDAADRRGWTVCVLLAVPSLVHAYLMSVLPSFTRYGDPATDHNFFISRLERLLEMDLTPIFPSFRHPEPVTWLTAAIYGTGILALSAIVLRHDRPLAEAEAG
jgi:hypothetical protein